MRSKFHVSALPEEGRGPGYKQQRARIQAATTQEGRKGVKRTTSLLTSPSREREREETGGQKRARREERGTLAWERRSKCS